MSNLPANEPHKYDAEQHVKRNPHPDFKKVESMRPDFERNRHFTYTKAAQPDWKLGSGANDGGESLKKNHVEIDPYADGRPAVNNYKLLISGIVPRPIGFVSTQSKDGKSTNLAPFSYTQVVNHDPPILIIGFAGGYYQAKDSLRNITDTGECTVNIISEHYLEAANACSINAPLGVSEWALSGLTPAPSTAVKPDRVKEAVFTTECKLIETREWESRATPGKKTGVTVILEGVKFWVREDATNEERNSIDISVLRPMSRLGGISYARVLDGVELPRPDYHETLSKEGDSAKKLVREKGKGQL